MRLSFPDDAARLQVAEFRRADLADYRDHVDRLESYAKNVSIDREQAAQRAVADAERREAAAKAETEVQAAAEVARVLAAFRSTCRAHGGTLTRAQP